ncbi:MAG: hypothetical protein JOY54_02890 [Acidobacteriaceae bacterium]|nr:hypothetical protein [Acidobacteriaceae bacterium]
MHRILLAAALLFAGVANWRAASESELKEVIPARAPVEKEHIETEFRTASGITDGKGRYIAGVVLITAGYSAEGKYSHYLLTQVPIKIGELSLGPGDYVFGWQRADEALSVKFYTAQTGKFLGTVAAPRINRVGRIESFHIYPPGQRSLIQIGRFAMSYELGS